MTNKTKKTIIISITILIIIFIVFYLYKNINSFKSLKNINYLYLIPIGILTILSLYINGIALNLYTKPFNLSLKEHFSMSLATSFLNLITPFRGGMGFRAIYLKKKYDFPYSKFIATLFGNYIIIFIIISILGIISTIFFYLQTNIFIFNFFLLFIGILLITSLSIMTNFRFKTNNYFTESYNKIMDGFNVLKKNKKLMFYICLISILNIFILTIINHLTFLGLGFKISYFESAFLSIINTLSTLINITPGSLGITEAFYFVSAKSLNIPTEISILASLIIRSISIIIILSTGGIAYIKLIKSMKVKAS
jgi:uncharacterized protein (TIRG00374 family)